MIEHFALQFCEAYGKLCRWIDALHVREKEDCPKDLNGRQLSDGYTHCVAVEALAPIVAEIERLGFDRELVNRAKKARGRLSMSGERNWTAQTVLDELIEIRRGIGLELKKHKFAYLRSPNDQYFEQDRCFGSEVYDQFQKARADIKDACNCFAVELYTACVFHLMRVAEHGLRVIAKRLRVTVSDNGEHIPIKYVDWNKVITMIDNKLKDARKNMAGAKKEARLNYYSDALERCSAMKDLYRNPVSHTRTKYTHGSALDVMERVRNFMQFLARPVPR